MRPPVAGLAACALAFVGGGLAALAHPPYGVLPGLFGWAAILHAWSLDAPAGRRGWAAFARGWAAGTGYLLVCTLWIGEAFLVDAAAHAWQAPFAIIGLSAGVGLLWGAAGLLCAWLAPRRGVGRVALFAAAIGLIEWVRGHVFTGFPWDLPGETWRAGSALSQGAALFGAYGQTTLSVAIGAAPALLARGETRIARLTAVGLAVALVGLLGGWGDWRMAHERPATIGAAPLRVRLVQPNLPEPPGWSAEIEARAVALYTGLTARPAATPPDLVIWPEGAIPDSFNALYAPGSAAAARIAAALPAGATLLTGGYRVEGTSEKDARYHNSLVALRATSSGLALLARPYDKYRLVPFGEYLPLAGLAERFGLRAFIGMPSDFTPGPPPTPLVLGALTVQPLICYEALFPALAAGARGGPVKARLLVNVSDDAWFGRAAGPWQHFNLASYRAIEEGLPMARATPTGVSAVIDGFGRPTTLLAPGRVGVVDAVVPSPLAATPYARWRDAPFWLLEAAVFLLAWVERRRYWRVTAEADRP